MATHDTYSGEGVSADGKALCAAYDPYDERVRRDPYPYYAALREGCPVHYLERLNLYSVSRFEATAEILRRNELFSSAHGPGPEPFLAMASLGLSALANADQPDHTRQRKLVNKAFTPQRVAALEPYIDQVSNSLIDQFCERGSAELVSEYAYQLPKNVAAELFGVPVADRERLNGWTQRLVDGLRGDSDDMTGAMDAMGEFAAYVLEKAAERQAVLDAGGEPTDDLLGGLVKAQLHDDRLEDMELVMIAMQVLNGGESTIGMIANMVYMLCTHPSEMEKLTASPDLIDNVVEEALRLEPPIQGLCRTAREEVELEGEHLSAGARLCALFASANRDPSFWGADAEAFRVDRDTHQARQHLSFGFGAHYCLGAPLARLEGRVSIRNFLKRLPNLRLDDRQPRVLRDDPLFFRGWNSLPIQFTPTPRSEPLAS